jgi:hypothetical protein
MQVYTDRCKSTPTDALFVLPELEIVLVNVMIHAEAIFANGPRLEGLCGGLVDRESEGPLIRDVTTLY